MKNLAAQAAKATDQVGARLTAIRGASGETAERINAIGGIVDRMDALSGEVADEAARQGAVAATIAASAVGRATATLREMSGIAADAEKQAANVQSGSKGLPGRADAMAGAVEGFLASVRRA